MAVYTTLFFIFVFLIGLVIGSFLNVCIYRIPKKEDIVFTRSHCMCCGHQLHWYELIPVVSYLMQRGRCRACKEPISIQYPLVELMNAAGYVWIFLIHGCSGKSVVYCLFTSALIVISLIDLKEMIIPAGCNIFLLILGAVQFILVGLESWKASLFGAVCVSGFLFLIYLVTKGRGIGGGDIKLTAVCGLLLGAPKIIVGFLLGCILASVIHLIRMGFFHAGRTLAFGPYLCAGFWIALMYGDSVITWYLCTL